MACKCKDDSKKAAKYSDNGEGGFESLTGIRKAMSIIFRILFGIIVFSIVIVVLPFAIIYVGLMAVFGDGVKINLRKLFRVDERK